MCVHVYININDLNNTYMCICMYMSSGQNYMLNELDAIYKLGWSPIGCEDFSIPRSIKTGVSV